jgi:hypothetical protein
MAGFITPTYSHTAAVLAEWHRHCAPPFRLQDQYKPYTCPLAHVTIQRDGDKLGTTRFGVQKPDDAIVLFSGPMAEIDWSEFVQDANIKINTYAKDQDALVYLAQEFGDLEPYYLEALLFISEPRIQQQIDRVAQALLERTTLTADEVREEAGFSGPLLPH